MDRTQVKQLGSYNKKCTHLIVDFGQTFEIDQVDIDHKLILITAALNKCKIIRFEWITHSLKTRRWLNELKYSIESYLDHDLDEYDPNDFDVRLIKLIRRLKEPSCQLDRLKLFSHLKSVCLINENEVESDDENELSFSSGVQTTYDYLNGLLNRFGANLTSRASVAEAIILIDRNNELAETDDFWRYFRGKNEKEIRKRSNVQIVSSNWIIGIFHKLICLFLLNKCLINSRFISIECVLELNNVDRNGYEFQLNFI